MFKSLRIRLTFFFVLTAGIVYITLALAGGYVLQNGLDSSLNDELLSIANEVDSIVDMSNLEPELTRLRHRKANQGFMPTIQFFDRKQRSLGYSGPIKNVPFLPSNNKGDKLRDIFVATDHLRVLTRPVSERSEAGWIQLAISLRQRDMAITSYYNTCAMLSPMLLLGLALSGYLFSQHAIRPVEQSFSILRNFVADAGHELNTPIAIMQANVEALSEDLSLVEPTLPVLLRTCDRMATLVGDLLLLAKLEAPGNEYKQRSSIDLFEMAEALYEDFLRLYQAKNIELSCDAQEGLIVHGDRDEINRAITNLLKNALNYTDSGKVSLRVSRAKAGNHVEIAVTDTGKGIPDESLSRIFDRFYRVDKHRARNAGGSGLGLAIVKVIVENHGGSISVKSSVGEGSTFAIELPLSMGIGKVNAPVELD
jgi:signal transduction histidine kinase